MTTNEVLYAMWYQPADAAPLRQRCNDDRVKAESSQPVQAVIQRQQGIPSESDDDRFFFGCQHGGAELLRSHRSIGCGRAFAPLLNRRRLMPKRYASFITLS